MIRLLLNKLLPYRSFARFSALHVGGIVLLIYVASSCNIVQLQGHTVPLSQWFTFPEIWTFSSALAHWLYYIPAFFVVQIICAEFELKLVRAQVIAGLERYQIIGGWVVQNLLLTAFGVAATVATASLVGHDVGAGKGWAAALAAAAGLALSGIVFLNFAMLSAVLLRRPVPALAALLLWPAVAEPVLGAVCERYGLAALRPYLPFATLGRLAPFPRVF